MKKINVALLGFGNLGQSVAGILLEKKEQIEKEYNTTVNVVAITTKTRGNLVDAWGIDLERVLNNIQESGVFPKSQETMLQRNALDVAEAVEYDVLIEMTPLEFTVDKTGYVRDDGTTPLGDHWPAVAKFKITAAASTGVNTAGRSVGFGEGLWYTIDGRTLSRRPSKGVFIHQGKAFINR